MVPRLAIAILALEVAACRPQPGAPLDGALDLSVPDLPLLADRGSLEGRASDLLADRNSAPPPCTKSPCADRPIIFLHGHGGSNDDFVHLLDGLVAADPRYDSYQLFGLKEPLGWSPRSFDRRAWLFAFDYYLQLAKDGRGSYTAGPGRIGSNSTMSCTQPPGKGHLVATEGSYNQGANRDYAADLDRLVTVVLQATGAQQVDLVGHSMGGMILRSYLSFYGGAAKVRRALLLASPVKGVSWAIFANFIPGIHPDWMDDHEVAEIDSGGPLSKIRFWRCGANDEAGSWGGKLVDHELLHSPSTELYVMSGQLDLYLNYEATHHPLALSHEVVSGASHGGILEKPVTLARVRDLLGGIAPP